MPQSRSSTFSPGVLAASGAALIFGTSTPLTKVFLNQTEPWMLAGLMFAGGGLGLAIIYLLRFLVQQALHQKQSSLAAKWGVKDLGWLGASTLAGEVIGPVLFTLGLTITSASSASLLLNFESVFTALLAGLIFGERLGWRLIGGIAAITAGGIILSQAEGTYNGLSWGSLMILGTCLGWAIDSNMTQKIADRDPLQVAMLKSGTAGIINVAIALAIGQSFPQPLILLATLGTGFLCYGVTLILFVLALRHIGASRTGAFFALSPFVGATISAIALGERVTVTLMSSAVLMAVGVGFCLSDRVE